LKAGLLHANSGKGIREILGSIRNGDGDDQDWLAKRWHAGHDDARAEVADLLTNAGMSEQDIMGQTLSLSIDSVERIDRMIASSEARRGNALREIDRHRATLGSAFRAIAEAEDAKFTEIAHE